MMAEGFGQYHVPQQSRRDKLRVSNQPVCIDASALIPFYDPSLISSDLINPANHLHRHTYSLGHNPGGGGGGVKEEGMNLMGFLGGMNINHMYSDPQLSVQLNPSSIQDITTCNPPPPPPCPYAAAAPPNYYSFHGNQTATHHQELPNSTTNGNGQSLSLSLSSHHHHHHHLPLELNLQQRYDDSSSSPTMFGENKVSGDDGGATPYVVSKLQGGSFTSIDQLSKSFVPLGPFTGYASVLKGSRFLKPAQQLMEELCDAGRVFYSDKSVFSDNPPPLEAPGFGDTTTCVIDDNCSDGSEQTRKKSRLLSMLDEVYKRYKQYYQQMQAAVAAFESVAGLSTASPFANLALKALSKHFRCLKNAITDQLQFPSSKSHGGKSNYEREDTNQRPENSGRGSFVQRPFHLDQTTVWRPQRGLPEHAVTVLRAWLFEHFLHPYPTDTDKLMLAKQTGLSRNQVSNWFINARVRLWKPMVEEIHTLETHQGTQKPNNNNNNNNSQREDQQQQTSNNLNDRHLMNMPTIDECENASTSVQRIGEFSLKRNRDAGPAEARQGNEAGPIRSVPYGSNLVMHNSSSHHLHVVGGGGGGGGVSLTLGLHQNGVGLGESYPMHAARRFGLDLHGDGYQVSGFAAQNRQFGRDVMDGQMMHDFVG
ncbi:hypothetical protein ABFX02_10G027100 [Erythranthe guttata]